MAGPRGGRLRDPLRHLRRLNGSVRGAAAAEILPAAARAESLLRRHRNADRRSSPRVRHQLPFWPLECSIGPLLLLPHAGSGNSTVADSRGSYRFFQPTPGARPSISASSLVRALIRRHDTVKFKLQLSGSTVRHPAYTTKPL